ncbi:hypothetical protein HOL24_05355 [bacterium]|jgi:hypothetical protein|nr:hypothetical protein [bacterium]
MKAISVLLLFAFPVVITVIFPSPYFYVLYDSEPDYFSNIASLYINKHTVDYLHPGLPITYVSNIFLKLTAGSYQDPEKIILTLRLLWLYINILIIYISTTRIANFKIHHVLLLLSIFLMHPYGFYFYEIISPNSLLLSLSVLLVLLGLNVTKSLKYSVWYGIILALALSVKFSALIMSIPLILTFFVKMSFKIKQKKYKKIAILVGVAFVLSSCLFLLPIIPLLPFYLTQWNINFSIWPFVLLGSVGILLFFYKHYLSGIYKNLIAKMNYQDMYTLFSLILFSVSIIVVLFAIISHNSFIGAARESLNVLFLFSFSVLLINKKSFFKFSTHRKLYLFIFTLLITVKSYTNTMMYSKADNYNLLFNKFIASQQKKGNKLAFFPVSKFSSKEYFSSWSDYRYGDRINNFHSSTPYRFPSLFNSNGKTINILNYTFFSYPDNITHKFSYKYFNKLLKNEFISSIYYGILKNHEYLLHKKDICNKPYDDYHPNDRFVVVIPISGHYLDIKSSDDNSDHYKNIANMLSKSWRQCDYKVHIESENIEGNELLLLFVDSNRSNF